MTGSELRATEVDGAVRIGR